MIRVSSIFDRVKRIAATCEEARAYELINDAIHRLSNECNWDPLIGNLSICTSGCEITLPEDVDIPLAVQLDGVPGDPRNQWFEFHANGPGACSCACWSWVDGGPFPTFQDIVSPSYLVAFPEEAGDAGKNVRVYGYDDCNRWIMEDCGGVQRDGFSVPITLYGFRNTEYKVSRVTAISKPETVGRINLVAIDPGTDAGTLVGQYRPSETSPIYRRIKLTDSCPKWVKIKYRRKQFSVSRQDDVIFLPEQASFAIILGVKAILKFENDLSDEGNKFLADAIDFLEKRERTVNTVANSRVQFRAPALRNAAWENLI